jgi:tetratricopeptide (TPR) repeat protein
MYIISDRAIIHILIVLPSILFLSDNAVVLAGDSAADVRYDAVGRQFDQALKQHDARVAKRLAYEMISLQPDQTRGYKNLCYVEDQLRNYNGAISAISKALQLEKDNAKCLRIRARVYAESDQDNLAKLDYHKAVMVNGESADFYGGIAVALERLDDYEGALTAIQKALKLSPDEGNLEKTAGRLLGRLNRLQEAGEHLRKACRLSPGESEPWRDLATVDAQLKRPDAVIADTTSAIQLGRTKGMRLVDLYRLRAESCTTLGRFQEAKEDYDRCIQISPLQRTLFQARANVNQKLGDVKAADQDVARVKSLDKSIQPFNGF